MLKSFMVRGRCRTNGHFFHYNPNIDTLNIDIPNVSFDIILYDDFSYKKTLRSPLGYVTSTHLLTYDGSNAKRHKATQGHARLCNCKAND